MAVKNAAHNVALFNPGETEHNTIVLGGVNVVVPLELDMDGDPFQDDAVCLRSHSGGWEHVCVSSDPEVLADAGNRHLYYPFHDVPSGIYRVDVMIAGRWVNVISKLLVSRGAAWLGGKRLGENVEDSVPAFHDPHLIPEDEQTAPAGVDDDCGCAS